NKPLFQPLTYVSGEAARPHLPSVTKGLDSLLLRRLSRFDHESDPFSHRILKQVRGLRRLLSRRAGVALAHTLSVARIRTQLSARIIRLEDRTQNYFNSGKKSSCCLKSASSTR